MSQAQKRPGDAHSLFRDIYRVRKWGRPSSACAAVTLPPDSRDIHGAGDGECWDVVIQEDRVILTPNGDELEGIKTETRDIFARRGSLVMNVPELARKVVGIRRGEHVVATVYHDRIEYRPALDALEVSA